MKMTLSSPINTTTTDKSPATSENNHASPKTSPKPSPRPQTKRDHARSDIQSTVNYKDLSGNIKYDGSPSSQDSSSIGSRMSYIETNTSPDVLKPESSNSSSKDRKEQRGKKKSSWFNSFYPTYKSRSGDFKRIFKDVPDDERLVVDYSCALQKEILVQGRLYVTQNYLCFHANIFGWETTVNSKWKDVSAITKEKTARVIPNAVLISTRQEKYFFTSFVARDKTYLMLFRVWQNALMDQPMLPQEMWQWVHQSYGDELGLTSDDEDYVAPSTEDDKLSVESFLEQECGSVLETINMVNKFEEVEESQSDKQSITKSVYRLPTDLSDTTESDAELPTTCDRKLECTASHEGRQLLNEILSIHIDQIFTLLFTSSKFFLDFHSMRKTTDLTQTHWTHNKDDNTERRIVNLTIALNQTMGPKTAQVTECQIMLPCSKAGYLYAIDVDTMNSGIPYADSFNVEVHHCLQKISETQSLYSVYAQVKYKKSVWSLVKGMIEKSCWSGLEDFYLNMSRALQIEAEENIPDVKRKSRRKRRNNKLPLTRSDDARLVLGASNKIRLTSSSIFNSDVATIIVFSVLTLLVVLNLVLYYKLWSLEENSPSVFLDFQTLENSPKSHDEWIKLLQQQETLHSVEIQKWQRILKTAIELLKQTEVSLNGLQRSIGPSLTNRMMSTPNHVVEEPQTV